MTLGSGQQVWVAALALLAACYGQLPEGTTSFTAGRTTVRVDSTLDLLGVVVRLSDTTDLPARGPQRRWLRALVTELSDSAFALGRGLGPTPAGVILETYAAADAPDSTCGLLAAGMRRCFGALGARRAAVRAFIDAARGFGPRAAPLVLVGVNAAARRRDLSDVHVALTRSRSLDSAVAAYSGYSDLSYDVTLARTFWTGQTSPSMDPAGARGPVADRIFLAPDLTFPVRSYRSPSYIWLALGHQMAHLVVRRLFAAHPELADRSIRLRPAVESWMVRTGYTPLFWDEALGEQLARAITVRLLRTASPSIVWAARSEALSGNMTMVPWFEDALERYERQRDRYPTLSEFAGELETALDSMPLDTCRASRSPGLALVGVARRRAVAAWIGDNSPFRETGLLVGDTVVSIDGDSVSAGGLLVPTRQLLFKWSDHLPAELATIGIRRRGQAYVAQVPITWVPRQTVRIPSQARSAVAKVGGEYPICPWVRRAVRR